MPAWSLFVEAEAAWLGQAQRLAMKMVEGLGGMSCNQLLCDPDISLLDQRRQSRDLMKAFKIVTCLPRSFLNKELINAQAAVRESL